MLSTGEAGSRYAGVVVAAGPRWREGLRGDQCEHRRKPVRDGWSGGARPAVQPAVFHFPSPRGPPRLYPPGEDCGLPWENARKPALHAAQPASAVLFAPTALLGAFML